MVKEYVIGCVGKPSAGKSSFFNAISAKAQAKVGAFPFTTIEPNKGVAYYRTPCPCADLAVSCTQCVEGERYLPVQILDVAGLIPGASEGLGLGNKFLDDLRHAHLLIHIMDVSGTTNEKGEETLHYDPTRDHEWLIKEIECWIFNNLWSKWGAMAKKGRLTRTPISESLAAQLSGYGVNESLVVECLKLLPNLKPNLDEWDKDDVTLFVSCFVKQRFPFILALNKADKNAEVNDNILAISAKFNHVPVIPCTALIEIRLQELVKKGLIRYQPGAMWFDEVDENLLTPELKEELELIKDTVLFRFGSSGCHQVIQTAIEMLNLVPVFPVVDIKKLTDVNNEVLGTCFLVHKSTTVRQLARLMHFGGPKDIVTAEDINEIRLGQDEELAKLVKPIIHLLKN